ncbi:unnamed protein product, partial [Adineta steineri]
MYQSLPTPQMPTPNSFILAAYGTENTFTALDIVRRWLMDHLRNIIEDSQYTKLDHSLNHTDLNPKDKQNYRSCEKIASDAVLNILKNNANMQGTFIYIYLLRLIITVYVQRRTPILTRLKSAWIIVFVCRLWLAWLKKEKFSDRSSTPNDKQKY